MSADIVAILAFGTISLTVASANSCVLSDCSIPSSSNCTRQLLDRFIGSKRSYSHPEQTALNISDSDHLLNLLNDSPERKCINWETRQRFFFVPFEQLYCIELVCHSVYFRTLALDYVLHIKNYSDMQSKVCIKHNAIQINAEYCSSPVGEKLRLTFFGNGDGLLMEDLSGKVPNGTSLMLQKTNRVDNTKCECPNVGKMIDKNKKCATIEEMEALEQLRAKQRKNETSEGKLSRKQSRNYASNWIIGFGFGCLVFLGIVGMGLKMKLLAHFSNVLERRVQRTTVTFINVK